jgi:hypothetical protein
MKLDESGLSCQIPNLKVIGDRIASVESQSMARRLKLFIRRRLSPRQERAFKNFSNNLINHITLVVGGDVKPAISQTSVTNGQLKSGDWVRVRSIEEIQASLNHWRQLKGCAFMPEMAQYCETTQRVLKPMQRFVDERDLIVKRTSGIILLEGVMCQGTANFGRCDRSCLFFWREEWLEKID